jgi:hypothetical protein
MYPLDVVKTRFQLQTAAEARYSSVLGTFRDIIKTEGYVPESQLSFITRLVPSNHGHRS